LTLLFNVYRYCEQRNVRAALIGAGAMSVHGVARATTDSDLMTTDRRVLDTPFWSELAGAAIDARKGDFDDPLAGVVRIKQDGEIPVDVVVAKYKVQAEIVSRAEMRILSDGGIAVVSAVDLILLKLLAGGPQDAWDIASLLGVDDSLRSAVNEIVHSLPDDAQQLWEKVK
jgi:hypothetical protein